MAEQTSREKLKRYFVTEAIPTEGNFVELIDATLNTEDDGLKKSASEPLAIDASGAKADSIHLYSDLNDAEPNIKIKQKLDENDTEGGLNITNQEDTSLLFIRKDGKVSVGGAVDADAKLKVHGKILADGNIETTNGKKVGIGGAADTNAALKVHGNILADGNIETTANIKVGIGGAVDTNAALKVHGKILADGNIETTANKKVGIGGAVDTNAALKVHGNILADGNIETTANKKVGIGGAVDTNAALKVHGNILADGNIETTANKKVGIGGAVDADAALKVHGNILADGNIETTANKKVGIGGAVDTNAALKVTGGMIITGTFQVGESVAGYPIPVGGIIMWSGTVLPPGWALCDGQSYRIKKRDGNYINVTSPDLRGRFIVGRTNQKPALGNSEANKSRYDPDAPPRSDPSYSLTGGGTFTLDKKHMPPHNHSGNTGEDGAHSHTFNIDDKANVKNHWTIDANIRELKKTADPPTTQNSGLNNSPKHSHTILWSGGKEEGKEGKTESFDVIPAYYVLAFIMKVDGVVET